MIHHTTLTITIAQTPGHIVILPEWVREYVDGEDDKIAKNYPVKIVEIPITFDDTNGKTYIKTNAYPGINISLD